MFKKFYTSTKSANQLNKERTRARDSILNNKELYPDLATQDRATIAGMHNGILETMESLRDSIFVLGNGKKNNTNKKSYNSNDNIGKQVYDRLTKNNLFEDLTKNLDTLTSNLTKNQSGQQLINNVIRINKVNYNRTTKTDMTDFQDLNLAFKNTDNILKNGGHFVSYDLETLGGTNSHGHQQFDYITELSATLKDNKGNVVEDINSLLGFSNNEYDKIKSYIEGLTNVAPSNYSEKDRVYLNRLSLLSEESFDYNMSGFEARVARANPNSVNTSIDNALKGLEKYREIGKKQELWLQNNGGIGLEDYKKQYIRQYKDLVYDGIGSKGTYNNFVALGHNTAMFDDKVVGSILNETVTHKAGRSLDTYQAVKYINEYLGQGAHIPKGFNIAKESGIGTQDALKNMFGYDKGADVAAHNAREDENVLFKILFDKNVEGSSYFNFLSDKMNSVNKSLNNLSGSYNYKKNPDLYLMDKTSQKSFNSMDNSLNFTYNPLDKSFKTHDGFRIDKEGKVIKESFNGFGPKSGALYSNDVFKIDLNKNNWKDVFSNFGLDSEISERYYDKYSNADYLYILKSQEYQNKDLLNSKFGADNAFENSPIHISLLTSEKELATAMGTRVASTGTDGSITFDNDVLNSLNLKTTKMVDGKVVVNDVESIKDKTDMLLNRSAYRTTTDSAARTIRDSEYERVAKLRRYSLENNYTMSQTISELISKNKTLDLNVTQNLIDELGWYDHSIKANKLLPETVAKTTVLDKYVDAIAPILDSMESVFKEMGIQDSFDIMDKEIDGATRKIVKSTSSKELKAKKNILFQNVLTNVLESLTDSPEFASNAKPSIFTADELNKIDFLRSDLFPGVDNKLGLNTLASSNSKFISIDLNKNDSILNTFFNNIYGDYDVPRKGNAGFDALFRAYETIGSDERFNGVWEDLSLDKIKSYQKTGNLSQLNYTMTEKLQSFVDKRRQKDSGFGLKFARNIQDYSDVSSLKTRLKYTDSKKLNELVRENMTNVLDDVYLADSSNNKLVDDIVNRYFMPFSNNDLNEGIKNLTADQQKVLRTQYNLSRNEAINSAKDLIESIKGTDINLGIAGKGKNSTMFLQRGNEFRALDMHRYELDNGIISHSINGNSYSTNFAIDVSKMINHNGTIRPGADLNHGIQITSNVQSVMNNTYNLQDTVKFAKNSNRDIMDALIYKVKTNNSALREVGPRRETFNYNNTIERAMQINTNSLIGILPELEKSGLIDEINRNFNIDPKNSKSMKELISKINSMNVRPSEIGELLASEQSLFYQTYQTPLISAISGRFDLSSIDSMDSKSLTKLINQHVQDTKSAKGILTLNNSPYSTGTGKFDKSSRSVANQQGNAILYSTEQLTDDLAFHKKMLKGTKAEKVLDNISIGNKITNAASEQFVNSVEKGKYTAGLSLKYLQINSDDLKNVFVNDVKNLREGKVNTFSKYLSSNFENIDVNKSAKYLSEKAMALSTYEQQSAINARISYMAMHKNNSQVIKAKKELIINHTDNISVIEANKKAAKLDFVIDKNGNVKYQLGYEVNHNQVLGMFGSDGNVVTSRFDGVFRGRYFDKYGNVVSEHDINTALNSNNVSKTKEAVRKFLGQEYEYGYEVMQKFENYGHKLYNDASEKSTADVMDVAIGKIDNKLTQQLRKAGFGDLEGRVLSRGYIDDYLKPALINKYGEKEAGNIYSRMLKERFSFSDMLSEYDIFQGVAQITNLNAPKHESVSMAIADLVENIHAKYSPEEAAKQYKALFPGIKIQDGKLFFDDVSNINEKLFDKLAGVFEGDNNKGVGHTGFSHVIHAFDDPSGTFSSNLDINSLRASYNSADRDIRVLESKSNLTDTELDRLTALKSNRAELDAQINGLSREKGLKFDNRMNLNLQRSVYNSDSFDLAKKNLSAEEFEKYFGHALDANGNISNKYLGKSILDPVTSTMRDQVLSSHGETSLSKYTGKKNIEYLRDSYKGMEDMISVEKAEKIYSYQQGIRALEYNTHHSGEYLDRLKSGSSHAYNNFKEVDLSKLSANDPNGWLDLDIGGQGRTITGAENNPYSQNLLIKTGLGDEHEYLAIGRTTEKHFEDSLIKESHVQKLSALQNRIKEINSLNAGSDKDKAITSAKRIVDDIVNMQKYDLTSKNGLYGDLISTRLGQSFFGKASGLTINSTVPLLQNPGEKAAKATYNMLKDLNGESFLDKAMFGDKSLLQHYSEGKVIDAVTLSEEAFEKMGYFGENFIESQLGKGKTKQDMLNALSTQGDMFLSTRFPRIQEGSDKVVMGYLDQSLKGNQIKALGHTGAAMNLDHDGDNFAVARISNGDESYLKYLNTDSANRSDFIASMETSVMERGATINRYWDSKIRGKLEKEQTIALSGNRLSDIAKERIIDGEVFSSIMDTKDMTVANMSGILDKYKDFMDSSTDDVVNTLRETHGAGTQAFENAKKEFATAKAYDLYKQEAISSSSKNAIGEINVSNYKIKTMLTGLMDKTADDYSYKSSLVYDMMHLSEQAAISSKTSTKGLDFDRAKVWNENAMDLIKGKGSAEEHRANMKAWGEKYLMEDIDPNMYFSRSQSFIDKVEKTLGQSNLTTESFEALMKDEKNKKAVQGFMIDDFVNTLDSLRQNNTGVERAIDYLSLGHSAKGVTKPIFNPTTIDGFENPSDKLIYALEHADADLNNDMNFFKITDKIHSSKFSNASILDDIVTSNNTESKITEKVLEGTADFFKSVKGNKLAVGALGVAAGIMTLGYIGGRPRPADAQAMEEAQDYPAPNLMDQSVMQAMPNMGQQGYIVNINARTDKGRNHAISAIQQALVNGTSSSINVSMNINDNYGNITDRDISNMFDDALSN